MRPPRVTCLNIALRKAYKGGMKPDLDKPLSGWRRQFYSVIFESDTRAGLLFDQALIWLILISVGVVILDSVASIQASMGHILRCCSWTGASCA